VSAESFPARAPTLYVIALEIVAEISPLQMTSVVISRPGLPTRPIHLLGFGLPRCVHWGEDLCVLPAADKVKRMKKKGNVSWAV
jgi:hypothetical protein